MPELVRQRALANGAVGRRWLEELPEILSSLAERWDLVLGRSFQSGTASIVTEAVMTQTGLPCVLKVAVPLEMAAPDSFLRTVRVHQIAAGRGCVELIAHDDEMRALLLERLGPNLEELGSSIPHILEAVARTLQTFWRPIGDDCGLPNGAEAAGWLGTTSRDRGTSLADRVSERLSTGPSRYCAERATAFNPSQAVLVHGDAHGWNTLDAGGGVFKFVDPEGLFSERAHDLGVPMREYNRPLLQGDTARLVRDGRNCWRTGATLTPRASGSGGSSSGSRRVLRTFASSKAMKSGRFSQ